MSDRPGIHDLRSLYDGLRPRIDARIAEFRRVWSDASEEELFAEMAFCLLTPQSHARRCWEAVVELRDGGLLLGGSPREIADRLRAHGVRFHRTKAARLVMAREVVTSDGIRIRRHLERIDPVDARAWLLRNIEGLGLKETSHFLRNIGRGLDLAILDRHILRNLVRLGVIGNLPRTLTPRRYAAIEDLMGRFSSDVGIPMPALDLLLWYRETGWIFK